MDNETIIGILETELAHDSDEIAESWSSNDLWESVASGDFILIPRGTAEAIVEKLKETN